MKAYEMIVYRLFGCEKRYGVLCKRLHRCFASLLQSVLLVSLFLVFSYSISGCFHPTVHYHNIPTAIERRAIIEHDSFSLGNE